MKLTKLATVSWKTTVLGVLAAIIMLADEARAVLDGDPETQPNVENLVAALALLGIGVAARDADKTSEQHQ